MGTSKEERHCDDCGTKFNYDESMKNCSFFLHIPLEDQLKQLLTDPPLYSYLTNRNLEELIQFDVITDVTTANFIKT
jgi:hypothetical protein